MNEMTEVIDSFLGYEIEIDPGMNTTLTKMAVKRAAILGLLQQLSEAPQVLPQFFRMDGSVFPSLPRVSFPGNSSGSSQAGLPHPPDFLFLLRIVEELHGRRPPALFQFLHQRSGAVMCLL